MPHPTTATPPRLAWIAMVVLAAAALALSAYLTYASTLGSGPIGCGGASGCGEVLASKWSKLLGLPVSGFAVLTYAAVLALLAAVRTGGGGAAWAALAALTGAIAGAAAWFIYVQIALIGEVCPYCMVDHAIGLTLAAVVFVMAPRRARLAAAAGLAAAGALAAVQWVSPAPPAAVHRVNAAVFDGPLDVPAEPHVGDPGAERAVVLIFDYACPHCRHAHGVIREHMRSGASPSVVLVAVPTPIHRSCNPFALEEMPARFDESCELARIALAVHLADAGQFEAFDAWMFEPEMPRSAEAARAYAAELVGAGAFAAAYEDARVAERVERNVAAYGRLGEMRRVPVTIVDGRDPVIGPVEDAVALAELLAEPPAVP